MGASNSPIVDVVPPAERSDLTHNGTHAERGKPVFLPSFMAWESKPQGKPTEVRVKEDGESERRFVIERIRVAVHTPTSPYAKAGRLPSGLSSRKSLINRHKVGMQMAVMKQFAQPLPTAMGKSSTDAPTHTTNG